MRTAVVSMTCCLFFLVVVDKTPGKEDPLVPEGENLTRPPQEVVTPEVVKPARRKRGSGGLNELFADIWSATSSVPCVLDREFGGPLDCFIAGYHRHPAPARVPSMLRVALKQISEEQSPLAPNAPRLVAHAFGYMAKGQTKLIRHYEARFEDTTKEGRSFLLESLRICGDASTLKQLAEWADDPRYVDWKKEIEHTQAFLTNPRRLFPRDRAARSPDDLDFLWADFLVTGDYAPVARILDALEQPRNLRAALEKRLKSPLPDPDKGSDVLAILKSLHLLEPNSQNKLVKGDLELLLLYDRKGRVRGDGFVLAAIESDCFDLDDVTLSRALLTQGAAAWSLQSNLEQHRRLGELLKKHYRDFKPRTKELVRRWLKMDQTFHLSKEAKELQGTWQAFAEESEKAKSDGPKLTAEKLKYVRWTFDEDEVSATRVLTLNKTKILGQGGTSVSTFEIDASRKPRRIVLIANDGDDWLKKYPCIYKLEGDVLTICMSTGKDFPKNFSADSSVVMWKLRRVRITPLVIWDLGRMALVESARARSGDPAIVIGLTLVLAAAFD